MILSHRIALDPTKEQETFFAKACGVARFAYNWALKEWEKQYKAGGKPTAFKLDKQFNSIKGQQFPWIYDSPKAAAQAAILNLGKAFQRFFNKMARYPQRKRKGQHDSYYVPNSDGVLRCNYDFSVNLPRIGRVNTFENLRLDGRIMSGTVSREAGRWILSIKVDVGEYHKPRVSNEKIGIDLGVKTALVLSDGQTFQAPNPLKQGLKKLRRLSRSHSRKQKGSNNRKKSQRRLAKHHARVSAIRRDWQHKVTTKLCRENQTIVLEDLNVKGMTRNHCLARAINDVGFAEIRRQLTYKSEIYGNKLVVINRWLPTSKTCSQCGCVKASLPLSERTFTCQHCGFSLCRDLNAARNILAAGLAASACGPESSGARLAVSTKSMPGRSRKIPSTERLSK